MDRKQRNRLACAIAAVLAAGVAGAARAEEAAAAAGELEEVVVTAVAKPTNRLDSSVSTSSVDADAISQVAPRSMQEIFRSLPGIRAESSGGEGNANITIRGIPLATGGSKYMQLMEDGLPVLEFGDLNFANIDNFTRYDWQVQRIESVRGGSASTFASNSPGGVINFISATGEKEGGAFGVSSGLDYREFRADFAYGGRLTDTLRFHVGGFWRTGEGVRTTGFDGDHGGQVRFNVTKEFDGGYLRLSVKHLDDHVSTYLPSAVLWKGGSKFGAVPGYDASQDSTYSRYLTQVNTYDAYGNRVSRDLTDGIHSKVDAFGLEFERDLGQGFRVTDRARTSSVSGGFISPFTDTIGSGPADAQSYGNAVCAAKAALGATGCGATVVTYAAGPNAGKAYGGLAFTNLLFDTNFRDVGYSVNDLKLAKDLGPVTATVGYYISRQKVAIDWTSWQTYAMSVAKNPVPLDIVSASGQQIASGGLTDPAFLSWSWDLNYTMNSPYLALNGTSGRFTWDASARFDHVRARGTLYQSCCGTGIAGLDYNGDGAIQPFEQGWFFSETGSGFVKGGSPSGRVDYGASYTSLSFGSAYRLNDVSSVFARYSRGARFSADRLLQIAGSLNADGSLTDGTKGYDVVKQLEAGYKYRSGGLSLYATAFHTKTDETNAEITSGLTFLRSYKAYGLELEGNWDIGGSGFVLGGNTTYTHARIDSDKVNPALVGEKPRRQADLIWTITPQYRAETWGAGVTLQGSSAYFLANPNQQANALKQGAYTLVNVFGWWSVTPALGVSLSVNNATNEFVVTEAEEATATPGSIVRARPLSARSTLLSLKYSF
jgi:outer membrane receptor protein involved in Fe transport